jgi:acetyltransferase-like isoleucine patch superfamily enzyme
VGSFKDRFFCDEGRVNTWQIRSGLEDNFDGVNLAALVYDKICASFFSYCTLWVSRFCFSVMKLPPIARTPRLKRLFYSVSNRLSKNSFLIAKGCRLQARGVKIRSSKVAIEERDCHVSIGEGTHILDSKIEVQGTGCRLIIGRNARIRHAHLLVQDTGTWLEIGEGTTMTGARFLVAGAGEGIRIGKDCMIAVGVAIRSSDMHSIIDFASGKRVNEDQSVTIGNHVWLGEATQVMKGAEIGSDCVVGAGSLVLGQLDGQGRVYAGRPAREVRSGVTWDRAR